MRLRSLIKLMATTPGYETLAKNAPAILNFKFSPSENADWYQQVFNDFLAWVLIYLDGLETNLCMIKASISETKKYRFKLTCSTGQGDNQRDTCFVSLFLLSAPVRKIFIRQKLQSVVPAFIECFIIGVFFGWYPAHKAANLNRIDSLRYGYNVRD